MRPKRVRRIKYTGTIKSYNKMVEYKWPNEDVRFIWFCDENGKSTLKFTGLIWDAMNGMIYRPGDFYYIDIKE